MKKCPACDKLAHLQRVSLKREDVKLCKECAEPCPCRGGFRANCTCDAEYQSYRAKRLGL
jgi:hypothetical protein